MTTASVTSGRTRPIEPRSDARRIRRIVRFNWSGLVYLLMTVFLLLAALNIQNNLLFLAFGVAISGIVLSGLLSGPALMGVRVTRIPAPTIAAGSRATIRYGVTSSARLMPVLAAEITETTSDGAKIHGLAELIRPRGGRTVLASMTPMRRGVLEFGDIELRSSFPFGLLIKIVRFQQPRVSLVHPRQYRVRLDADTGALTGQTEAVIHRPGVGGDADPAALREYRPGDGQRHIAWRQSARTGELRVIERDHHAQRELRFALSISGAAPGAQRDLELAVVVVASIAREASQSGRICEILLPDGGGERRLFVIDSGAALHEVLDALAMLSLPAALAPGANAGFVVIGNAGGPDQISPDRAALLFLGRMPTDRELGLEPEAGGGP